MPWTPYHTNLRDALAGLFDTDAAAKRILLDSGIPVAHVQLGLAPINLWTGIVEEATKRQKVPALVTAALKDYPDHPVLVGLQEGELNPTPARGPDIDRDIEWSAPDDEDTLEKIIGPENNLLPVGFLALGAERAKAVCRIVRPDHALGTGFLVAKDVVVTNNHVLPDANTARGSRAQFNYQHTVDGLVQAPEEFEFAAGDDVFWTSKDNDLSAARLSGSAGDEQGFLHIVDAPLKEKDRVSIIQHPGGGPKQVALHANTVVFAGDKVVQYLTDTMPGSSGAPVFDRNWRLAAVHHSGGWLREPGSKKRYYRNEGIPVALLKAGLEDAGMLG